MPLNEANVVVIPNKVIAGSVTTNYSQPYDDLIVGVPIGVGYESDLEHVEAVTLEIARELMIKIDGYQPEPDENGVDCNKFKPVIRYQGFNDSSIDFIAIMHVSTFANSVLLKHEFIKEVTRRYREEGINIPFPIRTLVTPDEDDKNPVNLRK